jgi:ABC-2 type transport system ATP-binding protein
MSAPIIDITDLSKFYGKARGIEHVNLEIGEGEIFGFIGPNGAGKSTTIRILLNLIFPSGGSARIMGMDVIRETKKIKHLVGYVPSDASAYASMNVHEFLSYFLRFYQVQHGMQRIAELSALFELDLKRKIAELSMGNRKKVAIVQSLLHRPKLLILDEPTTGLDPLMQAKFFELLRSENRNGMTIFFSSHILNEVQMLCRRVAIIKEGKIIQLEDIETLRKKQLKKGPFSIKAFLILSLYTLLLNLLFGAIGLFMSILVKRPKPITTLSIGLVLIFYFVFTLSKITESAAKIGYLSPFKYVNMDAINPAYKLNFWHLLYFIGISIILIGISYRLYNRKDIYL